uniref:Rabphilin 3Alike (Without C2 domains) [Octodon degus] n=1 Tax=Lepeophtheirus salmonis TaxID=72036 RepID=A0A0K2TYP3_LEPSM
MKKGSYSTAGGRRSSAVELTHHLTLSESSSSLTVGDYSGGSTSCVTSPVSGAGIGDAASGSTFSNRSTSSSASKTSNDSWVCPNDRQLALRAKLKSGWSVKTANLNQWKQPNPMSTNEHELILQVIEKAEAMERAEQQRVGRLVDRLEGMKRCCLGNGETDCILCGEIFRFYHRSQKRCTRCKKMTCGKCGVESSLSLSTPHHPQSQASLSASGNANSTVWLCKICNEGKEMWKKSGAWFYKGMPKYVLPEDGKGYQHDRRHSHYAPLSNSNGKPIGFVSAFGFARGSATSTSLGGSPVGSHDDLGFRSGSLQGVSKGMLMSMHHSDDEEEEDDSDEVADGMLARRRILNNHRLSKEVVDSDDSGSHHKLRSGFLVSEDSSRSLPISIPLARSGASTPGRSTPPYNFPTSTRPLTPTGCRYYGPPLLSGNTARYYRPPTPHRGSSPYRGPRPPHFRPPSSGSPSPPFSSRGPHGMVMVRRGGAGPPPRLRYPRSFRGGRPPPRCPPQIVSQSAPHSPLSPQRIFPGGSGGGSSPIPSGQQQHFSSVVMPLKNEDPINEFLTGSTVAVSANMQAKLAAEKLLQEMHKSDDLLGRAATKGNGCNNSFNSNSSVNNNKLLKHDFHHHNHDDFNNLRREDDDQHTPAQEEDEQEYDEEEEVPAPAAQPITQCENDSNIPVKYNKAKPLNEKENKFTSTLRRLSTVRRRSKIKRKIYLDRDENNDNVDKKDNNGFAEDGSSRQEVQEYSRLQEPPFHGIIELNLIFDEVNEYLTVNVVKAKRIKGMDINGLSDSYCKVTLVQPGEKVFTPQCTKTVAKSINPHYNAMLQFKGVNQAVIQTGGLSIHILDEDLPGDHLLAESTFPIMRMLPQMHKKFQISLDKPDLKVNL